MQSKKVVRFTYGALLLVVSILAPWWVAVGFAVLGAFVFPQLYEAIFAGVLIDLVFYSSGATFFSIPILFTLGGFVVYVLSEYLTKYLRLYE